MSDSETVALVLAGGGARGAYEMGALSVLLPALERRGQRPRLVVGTSVGALNTAYLAATRHQPVDEVVALGERVWREMRYEQILDRLWSPRTLRSVGAYLASVAGLPVSLHSFLDPVPLAATVSQFVSFAQLRANVAAGTVRAAVVATSAATCRSVVFHGGGTSPPRDDERGIDYVAADLDDEHVQGSAAIPVLFPAVRIERPAEAAGWYFDGGTRLNTPIKPALALGADRVVAIGLNAIAGREPQPEMARPDVAVGASQLIQAVLVDPLVNDVATLAGQNRMVQRATRAGVSMGGKRAVPYIFVAPRRVDAIGEIAARVFNQHFRSLRAFVRHPDLAALGRLLSGGADAVHGELLSYVFFSPQFTTELVDLGRADARHWLEREHDDGPWRIGSPPPQD